jgi:hypothetical protein
LVQRLHWHFGLARRSQIVRVIFHQVEIIPTHQKIGHFASINSPGVIFSTAAPDRGETILVGPREGIMFRFQQFFCISVFIHIAHVSLHYILWYELHYDRWCELTQVLESSNHHRGAFHPHVPSLSPLMPPASLKQLLTPLNAIVQKLTAIDEQQAGQSQHHQQPQESSYFNFWQHNFVSHLQIKRKTALEDNDAA